MAPSEMLRSVALVRTKDSEELRFLQEPHDVISQKTLFFSVRCNFISLGHAVA
jgi:hypothetical protein